MSRRWRPASRRSAGPEYYVLLVVGLVATVVATTMVARAAKKAMVEQAVTAMNRRSMSWTLFSRR